MLRYRCGGVQRAYYEISSSSVFNRDSRLFRCTDAAGSGGCLQPQYHSGYSDGPWRTGYQFSSGQVLHLCHREERNTCLCQQRMPQGAIVRGEPEESDLVQEQTGPACEDRAQLLARDNEVVVALKSGGTTLYAPAKTIVALRTAAAP